MLTHGSLFEMNIRNKGTIVVLRNAFELDRDHDHKIDQDLNLFSVQTSRSSLRKLKNNL